MKKGTRRKETAENIRGVATTVICQKREDDLIKKAFFTTRRRVVVVVDGRARAPPKQFRHTHDCTDANIRGGAGPIMVNCQMSREGAGAIILYTRYCVVVTLWKFP